VLYFTAPAISEAPFPYTLLAFRGRGVEVDARTLPPP
jgi:hypothetical protein